MRSHEIQIGGRYTIKASGAARAPVVIEQRIEGIGWIGRKVATGRRIFIRSAGRLRREQANEC